eukprot:scaffold5098_cov249-Alexandrium_tamarense.AAC.6
MEKGGSIVEGGNETLTKLDKERYEWEMMESYALKGESCVTSKKAKHQDRCEQRLIEQYRCQLCKWLSNTSVSR